MANCFHDLHKKLEIGVQKFLNAFMSERTVSLVSSHTADTVSDSPTA